MKPETWLALIAIIVSIIAVPASAIFSYHYARKQFEFQITRERTNRLLVALSAAISFSEQLGSLISTEATMKLGTPTAGAVSTEAQSLFDRHSENIYAAVAKWPICTALQSRLDTLIECGIIAEIEHDSAYYDKFISLYWQLCAHHISDKIKIRVSHEILYSHKLLKSLKTTAEGLTKQVRA